MFYTSGDVAREGVTSAWLDGESGPGSGTQGPEYGHLEEKGKVTIVLVYLANIFKCSQNLSKKR